MIWTLLVCVYTEARLGWWSEWHTGWAQRFSLLSSSRWRAALAPEPSRREICCPGSRTAGWPACSTSSAHGVHSSSSPRCRHHQNILSPKYFSTRLCLYSRVQNIYNCRFFVNDRKLTQFWRKLYNRGHIWTIDYAFNKWINHYQALFISLNET